MFGGRNTKLKGIYNKNNITNQALVTAPNLVLPTTQLSGTVTNAQIANTAVANLSGTNTGDQTNISGNAATVTTNANLTGDVTSVGNASTLTAAVTASKFKLSSNGVPSCSVYNSTPTTLAAAGFTKIALQTKNWDLGSFFDSTTNYRYLPTVAGTYSVSAQQLFSGNITSTTQYGLALYKNGTLYKWLNVEGLTAVATTVNTLGSCSVQLNGSTDYIELFGYNGNATLTTATSGVAAYSYFDVQWQGPLS